MHQILTYHTATLVPTTELKLGRARVMERKKVAVTSVETKTKTMLTSQTENFYSQGSKKGETNNFLE